MIDGSHKSPTDALLKELRAYGLAYPGTQLKSPWPGHMDVAVKDKTFVYLSVEGEPLGISCKLPHSGTAALMLPFTKPTAYGLGKSGWVSAQFAKDETPPIELLKEWIDESYRAQAPKKLLAALPGAPSPARKPPTAAARAKPKPKSPAGAPRAKPSRSRTSKA